MTPQKKRIKNLHSRIKREDTRARNMVMEKKAAAIIGDENRNEAVRQNGDGKEKPPKSPKGGLEKSWELEVGSRKLGKSPERAKEREKLGVGRTNVNQNNQRYLRSGSIK